MWLRVNGLGLAFLSVTAAACGAVVTPSFAPPSATPTTAPTDTADGAFSQTFFIENRGGPAFTVRIDGAAHSVISCDAGEWLKPGEGTVPPLPWHLTMDWVTGGAPIFSQDVRTLPYWFVQIGESTAMSDEPILGPMGPSCGQEISQVEAIDEARQHTSLETLVSVAAGRFSQLNGNPGVGPGHDIKPEDLVWAVRFSGDIEVCGPSPGGCVMRPGTATVFLDFATGAFRSTQVHSPG
jgi:hypothetical protein